MSILPTHTHQQVINAFNLQPDYVFRVPFRMFDLRGAIMEVVEQPYVRTMLSPRQKLPGQFGTYITTNDLVSLDQVRKELMEGVSFALYVMGEGWLAKTVQAHGLALSFFFMAEAYQQLKATLWERSAKQAPKETEYEYDLQLAYIATYTGNIELCFPEVPSMEMMGRLFWLTGLSVEQIKAIRQRSSLITSHFVVNYTIH